MKRKNIEELLNEAQENPQETINGWKIYTFEAHKFPYLLANISEQRELAFRRLGGGTNNEIDVDIFDIYFSQIVIWDPTQKQIVGGFRINRMDRILFKKGSPLFSSFNFSEEFIVEYLQKTAEIGKVFINLKYRAFHLHNSIESIFCGIRNWIKNKENINYLSLKIPIFPKLLDKLDALYPYLSEEKLLTPKKDYKLMRRNSNNDSDLFSLLQIYQLQDFYKLVDDIVFLTLSSSEIAIIMKINLFKDRS